MTQRVHLSAASDLRVTFPHCFVRKVHGAGQEEEKIILGQITVWDLAKLDKILLSDQLLQLPDR